MPFLDGNDNRGVNSPTGHDLGSLLERVTIFNIKGNDYRLVVAINYRHQIVFIKWLGTHADYDKIDVKTVRYGHQAN
jgi:mRNA-degrading endonuclease HigB of HigAB toxin-antitoxin module